MNWQEELKTNIKSIKKLQNFINFDKNVTWLSEKKLKLI